MKIVNRDTQNGYRDSENRKRYKTLRMDITLSVTL